MIIRTRFIPVKSILRSATLCMITFLFVGFVRFCSQLSSINANNMHECAIYSGSFEKVKITDLVQTSFKIATIF